MLTHKLPHSHKTIHSVSTIIQMAAAGKVTRVKWASDDQVNMIVNMHIDINHAGKHTHTH